MATAATQINTTTKTASATLHETIMTWEGVSAHPHRFGGTEYRLGKREIGHVHGDSMADLPFPTRVRDELIASGAAVIHHHLPDSGWVSLYLRQPADTERALRLFERSYAIAWAQYQRRLEK